MLGRGGPELRGRRASVQEAGPEPGGKAGAKAAGGGGGGGSTSLAGAVFSTRFWLLSLAGFCGMGSGLMLLNNIAQVRHTCRCPPTDSAYSACIACGLQLPVDLSLYVIGQRPLTALTSSP